MIKLMYLAISACLVFLTSAVSLRDANRALLTLRESSEGHRRRPHQFFVFSKAERTASAIQYMLESQGTGAITEGGQLLQVAQGTQESCPASSTFGFPGMCIAFGDRQTVTAYKDLLCAAGVPKEACSFWSNIQPLYSVFKALSDFGVRPRPSACTGDFEHQELVSNDGLDPCSSLPFGGQADGKVGVFASTFKVSAIDQLMLIRLGLWKAAPSSDDRFCTCAPNQTICRLNTSGLNGFSSDDGSSSSDDGSSSSDDGSSSYCTCDAPNTICRLTPDGTDYYKAADPDDPNYYKVAVYRALGADPDGTDIAFCGAFQASSGCSQLLLGMTLNDGAIKTVINMIPNPEQATSALIALAGEAVEMGLNSVSFGISTVKGGFFRTARLYGPTGFVDGGMNVNLDLSLSGGFELPFGIPDIFSVSGTYTQSFALSGNVGDGLGKMLSPVKGASASSRAKAAHDILRGFSSLMTVRGDLVIGLEDLTGGLLQDMLINLGGANIAFFASKMASGTFNLDGGAYFSLRTSLSGLIFGSVMKLLGKICDQLDGVLDLLHIQCPRSIDTKTEMGFFVTPAQIGLRFENIIGDNDIWCIVKLSSKPNLQCDVSGTIFEILEDIVDAGKFVVKQLDKIGGKSIKELAKVSKKAVKELKGFTKATAKSFEKLGDAFEDAGKAIGDVAKDAGKAIDGAAKDAGNAIGGAAKDAGNAIGGAAKDVGKGISGAAKKVGKLFKKKGWGR